MSEAVSNFISEDENEYINFIREHPVHGLSSFLEYYDEEEFIAQGDHEAAAIYVALAGARVADTALFDERPAHSTP